MCCGIYLFFQRHTYWICHKIYCIVERKEISTWSNYLDLSKVDEAAGSVLKSWGLRYRFISNCVKSWNTHISDHPEWKKRLEEGRVLVFLATKTALQKRGWPQGRREGRNPLVNLPRQLYLVCHPLLNHFNSTP